MLSENSILRRIPSTLDPKQILFIDGIRHAVEMIDLAYSRLRENLTYLALSQITPDQLRQTSTHVFLDAWAIVDAIDRFRMLYSQMPGMTPVQSEPKIKSLAEITKPFRELRNVADHLSQRADFVVSKNGSALGVLTWITGFEINPLAIWLCTLRPGTIKAAPEFHQDSILTTIDWPTDQITLSAGGFEGNFSAVLQHIELRIKHFENQLENALKDIIDIHPVANDVLSKKPFIRKT